MPAGIICGNIIAAASEIHSKTSFKCL